MQVSSQGARKRSRLVILEEFNLEMEKEFN